MQSGSRRLTIPSLTRIKNVWWNSLAWLNDRIIEAALDLLRKQSQVPGFQDICLGMTMAFEIQRQPFVQILHDGHGHWLTISSIGGKPGNTDISVYDSMYLSVGSYTKKQIAAIVCSKENTITLNMRNVQLQAGGSDCGVFAIAFTTALANNINPCECCFKQDGMRDHLRRCLESGKLTMFPLVYKASDAKENGATCGHN